MANRSGPFNDGEHGLFAGHETGGYALPTLTVTTVAYCLFGALLLASLAAETYSAAFANIRDFLTSQGRSQLPAWKLVQNILSQCRTVYKDFTAGRYYLPFRDLKKNHVFVTSKTHISELSEAPELSQRAVYADAFGFDITLNNLSKDEQNASRYRLYGRVLKVVGPDQLATLYPTIRDKIGATVKKQLAEGNRLNDGWSSVPLASFCREINAQVMIRIFFGEKLGNEPEFNAALRRYPEDLVKSLIAFKLFPRFMRSFVHNLLTNGGKAMHTCLQRMIPIVQKKADAWVEDTADKELTLLHHLLSFTEDSSYWSPMSLSQAVLGIWLAAAFQPWMNLHFIILELCTHPDYMDDLRKEIADAGELNYSRLEALPRLDSFMKEVFRTKPLDNYVVRRQALRPFTFSDGLEVPVGHIACVSTRQMMKDESKYPRPHSFLPDRFVASTSSPQSNAAAVAEGCGPGTRLTDISTNFPIWGYGSLACPGRFHATFLMKAVIVHLLQEYDFKRVGTGGAEAWSWESFTIPVEKTRLQFCPRRKAE